MSSKSLLQLAQLSAMAAQVPRDPGLPDAHGRCGSYSGGTWRLHLRPTETGRRRGAGGLCLQPAGFAADPDLP